MAQIKDVFAEINVMKNGYQIRFSTTPGRYDPMMMTESYVAEDFASLTTLLKSKLREPEEQPTRTAKK